MAWFDKRARARKHMDAGREALAASIEEVAAQQELWDEDEDEEQLEQVDKASIIPPRLSLQSRAMPAVRIERAKQGSGERQQALPGNSSHLAAMTGGPRLGGRSTRVHLQAVRPDAAPEAATEGVRAINAELSGERGTEPEQRALSLRGSDTPAGRLEQPKAATLAYPLPPHLSGRGVLKPGQKDATIANPHISERSVVTVMLTDNPGPVVVQYVSLYPRRGFTFHLSAPAAAQTAFNYVIWAF